MNNEPPVCKIDSICRAYNFFVYIFTRFTSPQIGLAVGLASNIFAAPYGQIITNWVMGTGSQPNQEVTSGPFNQALISNVTAPNNKAGINAATALLIFYVNIFSFLLMNITGTVWINQIDIMERAHLISLSDFGYSEIQKDIYGDFFVASWLPVSTTLSFALGASSRPIKISSFLLGTALAVPVYFIFAHVLNLPVDFGDPTVPSLALGSTIPNISGYNGLKITAIAIQVAAISLIIIAVALYAWFAARISRAIKLFTIFIYRRIASNIPRFLPLK